MLTTPSPSVLPAPPFHPSADQSLQRSDPSEPTGPLFGGGFFMSSPARMFDQVRPFKLNPWSLNFYSGERLKAEVALLGSGFVGNVPEISLAEGCALLKASFGASKLQLVRFKVQKSLLISRVQQIHVFNICLFQIVRCFLFWLLKRYLPSIGEISADRRIQLLRRSALLLMTRFPQRPDLPYQVLMWSPLVVF